MLKTLRTSKKRPREKQKSVYINDIHVDNLRIFVRLEDYKQFFVVYHDDILS